MCLGFDSHIIYTGTFSSSSALAKDCTVWQFEHSQDSDLSQENEEEQKDLSVTFRGKRRQSIKEHE